MKTKKTYIAPIYELVELKFDGVLCQSWTPNAENEDHYFRGMDEND